MCSFAGILAPQNACYSYPAPGPQDVLPMENLRITAALEGTRLFYLMCNSLVQLCVVFTFFFLRDNMRQFFFFP